ncbi:L-threonylcarbamoyladenylate synthase [Thalassobacillus sp. C254]|uniref:L-threonylcarbamoyladenylate synthase n=1 Tax=Thalassobacillus sp. C254 TaxID=1225341 RepID=UPI000A53CBCD|nr:L-threonylcarbamoyladenylate synthase [Thalassobacillus sp. C254]
MDYKQTEVVVVDKWISLEEDENIQKAGMWISCGEVVALPTETVYGLGGNANSEEAIEKIFLAKGRPSDNPLIVHISERKQLSELVSHIPLIAEKFMNAFWPGPLTLILPKTEQVSEKVTGGLSTVAVRMPDHPVAQAVIKAAGVPVAAPSANRSGRPSPTTAEHVRHDLDGRIAGIVDGGPTGYGLESTVVDCTRDVPMILRPGGVTREELEEVAGVVEVDPALISDNEVPRSPGLKYRHYAPDAPLTLVEGSTAFLQEKIKEVEEDGLKTGVITVDELIHEIQADHVISYGSNDDIKEVAAKLYDTLRRADKLEADVLFSVTFPKEGVGAAVMNRLEKAAGGRIIKEE